jgi:hypothetical protein
MAKRRWQITYTKGGKVMSQVWQSTVTREMADKAELTETEINNLIKDLDEAVMAVCQDYAIE